MANSLLAQKGKIGNLETKNRLVMTAMGVGLGEWEGNVTDEFREFYAERAKGGAGVLITEIVRVNEVHGIGEHDQISLAKDSNIPSWKKLADALHQYDTKLFAQLHHPGKETYTALLVDGQPTVSSSAIPSTMGQQPTRALETEEVQALVKDFGAAAVRAKEAGVDGVELHAAHGYMIAQFLSAHANHRTDQYGGNLENRMRFLLEIIDEIHKVCGDDYPISVRLSGSEFMESVGVKNGITLDETIATAVACEKAGVDLINVSAGCYDTGNTIVEPTSYEQGWKLFLAKEVRKHVSIPVAATGVIRDAKFAESIIEDGTTDFVAMGRSWLADPEWGNKAIAGRDCDIRKCTGCMYCFETAGNTLVTGGGAASCSVNPRMGRETQYPAEVAKGGDGRKVVVVGAGPGGLEAAMTAAERGFSVTLLEKNSYLGGQMYLSSLPPHKAKMHYFISYAEKQMKDLGVEVRLNTAADAAMIRDMNPYAVIIATGSAPVMPRSIKGIDGENVYSPVEVLTEAVEIKDKRVCIIGSGLTGLETGEFLVEKGCEVSIYEMQDKIAPGGFALVSMEEEGALAKAGVRMCPGHKLLELREDAAVFEDNAGFVIEEPCDVAVVSLGIRPVNNLKEELSDLPNVAVIGDAGQLGRIPQAVEGGYKAALAL
jgi:2,4-dienoyl-CoA reductase-like NADH-dependent reductase (Old Yellow Enzyme family)/thioredoxin reductase